MLCALVFLMAAPALAGETPLDTAKETYGYDNWPGRDGALKQGIALKDLDLPPYEIKSVRNRLATSGRMILRYGVKGEKKILFEVTVKVLDTVLDAHEELITYLSACAARMPDGKSAGVEVGDVCYAAKEEGTVRTVVFVRNNIFVKVSLLGKAGGSETPIVPDIAGIAKKIDAEIKQAEEAQKPEDLNKPSIDELSAPGTATPDTPVEVTLKVSDPKNEKTETHIDEGGGMVYEQDGKRYFKAEKPGEYTITIYVMNEHFIVVKKSITIKVEKK